MTQAPLHTALLAAGAAVIGSCLLASACSKAAQTVTTTTVSTSAGSHPTVTVPNSTIPVSASADLSQTAAVSPPANLDGTLPASSGVGPPGGPSATGATRR